MVKEYDHNLYMVNLKERNKRLEENKHKKSWIDRAWIIQDRFTENRIRKKQLRQINKDYERATKPKSKWVMNIDAVKRFRNIYALQVMIAWFISAYTLLLFWNFTLNTLVGEWIMFGSGLYGFAHLFLMLGLDFAVYKRTKGKEDWFFSILNQ